MKKILEVVGISKKFHSGRHGMSSLRDSFQFWWRQYASGVEIESNQTLWALKDISFELKEGEALGVIGRNGAGKSTLLKILAQVTEPTKGVARIHGRCASLLDVGAGFHPDLTGRENVFLNGAFLGMKRSETARVFDEIVDFSEIEKFIDVPLKQYSKGMYTRLAFSVAAFLNAELLLMDEVLELGDEAFQQKALSQMKTKLGQGKSLLFVSHHFGNLAQLCGRALVLEQGRLIKDGNIQEALSVLRSNSLPLSCDTRTHKVGDAGQEFSEGCETV